jgi:hypothetical protein
MSATIAGVVVFMDETLKMARGQSPDLEHMAYIKKIASVSAVLWMWCTIRAHMGEMRTLDDNFSDIEHKLNELDSE